MHMDSHFPLLSAGSPAQINSHVTKVYVTLYYQPYLEQCSCFNSKAADFCEDSRVVDAGVGPPSCKQLSVALPQQANYALYSM